MYCKERLYLQSSISSENQVTIEARYSGARDLFLLSEVKVMGLENVIK
jgi:hypothetical protein